MTTTTLIVSPLSSAIGAEISGVDLSRDVSDAVIGEIHQALLDHCVIFFREQEIDTEQHKRLAKRFGDIFIHPNFNTGDHDPEVVTIHRKPDDELIVGEDWHTDTTMMAEPPMGALLYALDVPEFGGDTLFANQYLAYESLSDGMKELLGGMRCIHTDRKVAGPDSRVAKFKRSTAVRLDDEWCETRNSHPVIRTHPETGRKCLFVNHSYSVAFEGMTEKESAPLLNWLLDWGHRPEITCRFRWEKGSLAFWDNRCVKHIAVHDIQHAERLMRRVQIAGEKVA